MRRITKIICHHTATPSGSTSVEGVRRAHLGRGWDDIGYHYLVDTDGRLRVGRRVGKVGAHCKGENGFSIGISLMGRYDTGYETPNLRGLAPHLADLCIAYDLTEEDIYGHKDYNRTACPGYDMESVRTLVRVILKATERGLYND